MLHLASCTFAGTFLLTSETLFRMSKVAKGGKKTSKLDDGISVHPMTEKTKKLSKLKPTKKRKAAAQPTVETAGVSKEPHKYPILEKDITVVSSDYSIPTQASEILSKVQSVPSEAAKPIVIPEVVRKENSSYRLPSDDRDDIHPFGTDFKLDSKDEEEFDKDQALLQEQEQQDHSGIYSNLEQEQSPFGSPVQKGMTGQSSLPIITNSMQQKRDTPGDWDNKFYERQTPQSHFQSQPNRRNHQPQRGPKRDGWRNDRGGGSSDHFNRSEHSRSDRSRDRDYRMNNNNNNNNMNDRRRDSKRFTEQEATHHRLAITASSQPLGAIDRCKLCNGPAHAFLMPCHHRFCCECVHAKEHANWQCAVCKDVFHGFCDIKFLPIFLLDRFSMSPEACIMQGLQSLVQKCVP